MSVRELFDDSEWMTLLLAPLRAINATTGLVARPLIVDFVFALEELGGSFDGKGELTREVFPIVMKGFLGVWLDYKNDARQDLDGLKNAAALLDAKVTKQSALEFKLEIIDVTCEAVRWQTVNAPQTIPEGDVLDLLITVQVALGLLPPQASSQL